MSNITGEKFGQRRPPLSIYIKGILERYPDGQIFKEMIQNADDAGAKTIQFFIDHRRHGNASLPHSDLASYQGPALVSANDACFTTEDWEGIQKVQQSIKAEDPFKVGRFGIGFNSVYHVTDVPIIISGDRVGILDPQEKIWPRESGKSFQLRDLQQCKSDILSPFEGIAGFDSYGSPRYPKTLFRFPLRTAPSELSENVYTTAMVQELIDALRKEAKYLLLFLRSVVTVEVHNISEKGAHSLYFKVSVASSSKSELVKKRSKFTRRLKKAFASDSYAIFNCIEFSAEFHIEVFDPTQRMGHSSHKWLVTSIVGCSNPGSETLDLAKKQHVFPWVGAALEIAENPDSGRIFCFLPMPIETASGYPVHVNATFSLNDDRRSLKWPGAERKNDPAAKWNDLVVKELLPPCYVMLLVEAKKILTVKDFYCAWPNVPSVRNIHWKKILVPLFTQLFEKSVLWSENTGASAHVPGEWVSIEDSTFIPIATSLPQVVHHCLCNCDIQLVSIPQNIWAAIDCAKIEVKKVTPRLARGQLRSKPYSYTKIDDTGKYDLLKYCTADQQYNNLHGLKLLPLADGSFTSFDKRQGSNLIYVCTKEHPRCLLPSLNNQLVDVPNDFELQKKCYDIAKSKHTQLTILDISAVASLLQKAMPPAWKKMKSVNLPSSDFTLEWFQTFWKWVQNTEKVDLSLFEKLFIVPIHDHDVERHNQDHVQVVQLKKQQPLIYIPAVSECSETLLSAFTTLKIMCCMEHEFPYVRHNGLQRYLKAFDTIGMLDAIHLASSSQECLTTDEASTLRAFISQNSKTLSSERLNTLKSLSIFESEVNSKEKLFSIKQAESVSVFKQALVGPPECCFSLTNLPHTMILFSQTNPLQKHLLTNLKVSVLTDTNLLRGYIFPLVRRKSFPSAMLSTLMREVLDMFQVLQKDDETFLTAISSLPFIDISSGQTKAPCELYDPTNSDLKELFRGEKVFPVSPFDSPKYVQVLKQCGLQKEVSPQTILNIIDTISLSPSNDPQLAKKTKLRRAKAVLTYISSSEFLRRANEMYTVSVASGYLTFKEALNHLVQRRSWIPVLAERPCGYPQSLPWKGSPYNSHFVCLRDNVFFSTLFTQINPLLVGSQMFVPDPPLPQTTTHLFPERTNHVEHVLNHFKVIIDHIDQISSDSLFPLVGSIYQFLNQEWNRCTSPTAFLVLNSIPEWIYIKKCHQFVGPKVVALEHNSTFRHNLEPYLWILPESLRQYEDFFTEYGVNRNVTQAQIVSVLATIRNEVSSNNVTLDHNDMWGLVMSILNWITADGTREAKLTEEDTLYVPVESDNDLPQLMKADDVVYTDNDFLKDFLQSSDLEDEQFNFVHKRVNAELAECLGLSPLSEQLDISEDTFEDTGQQEPLTVRLKTILRDYKDGLTIVKELLQNADDAEATEVNICYDAREHTIEKKSLFFPGMTESHGPALIVHNNRSFSEEDFVNITKLGGATKLDKPLKIGKFGIGFCSVYHITDVPSFVSQDKLFVFDPTLSCLKKEIKNPALPGKKVKFTSKFISRSKQLSPYEGLFGFNSHRNYHGTLFRFPFRCNASEVSGTCYSEATVMELMKDIQESGSKLLLFLQHVKKITFQRIDEGETTPTVLLTITKESVDLPMPFLQSGDVKQLKCSLEKSSTNETHVQHWLVASDSTSINGRKACASVANLLVNDSSSEPVADLKGEIFCFLPISQKTGLPVHVSSNFAVINNRRGIWTTDDATSKTDTEVQWNISLMKTVIPNAYHLLVTYLQHLHERNKISEYNFYSLWPLRHDLLQRQPWEIFVNCLYQKISRSKLFYSASTKQWLYLANCKFLKQGILSRSTEWGSQTPKCVLDVLEFLKIPIVELPHVYHEYFDLEDKIITDIEFIGLFFKNLQRLTSITPSRNEVVLCLLVVFNSESDGGLSQRFQLLSQMFQGQPSIPSSPNGYELKQCKELIDPKAPFAELFESEKNHFPVSMLTSNRHAVSALKSLGMISRKLPWNMLIERAEASIHLHMIDKLKALQHIKLILITIESHMLGSPPNMGVRIESVKFLPVLKKPTSYPISWKGEGANLLSGEEMITAGEISYSCEEKSNVCIVGSQVAFVCEDEPENGGCGQMSFASREILKIRYTPTCTEVITHFQEFIEVFNDQPPTDELIKWANQISREVYAFLNVHMSSYANEQHISEQVHSLQVLPCVWTGQKFIAIKFIAKQWKLDGPYLYPVPPSMSDKEELMSMLKVKEEFTESDIQSALIEMKAKFGDTPIDDACRTLIKELISLLFKIKPEKFSDFKIILPDEQFILRWSDKLSYNDAPWAPKDESHIYVNGIISRDLAKQLHVNPVRSKLLEKFLTVNKTYFRGSEFGQREELTRRIQNILREYPFDITILKELLQNADDAKATKMYIILDKRTHGIETVLSEEWPKLQGPALLVWNDSTFSEKDLQGIQELGLGSKRSDAESIGQYGIGFNVVYHLTDCPSFITGGETLCIMDPHCKFVPGADPLNPGRRYDQLEEKGFWKDFPDMRSAYLRDGLGKDYEELMKGSLFRFPLRHTTELVELSKLTESDSRPLTADDMQKKLHSWAPQMKEAMLFLNHVTELRFFIIEEDGRNLVTERHYTTEVVQSAQSSRAELYSKVKAFKRSGCESYVVRYPLTITEITHSGAEIKSKKEEKWLIQQGVGDINQRQQIWQFVNTVKPRHGIAAPLTLLKGKQTSTSSSFTSTVHSNSRKHTFSGKVFCFLPLPVESKLPVHINGHFVLSSNRRELWHSTNPNQDDDRTRWNSNLLNAIKSSYANLLENVQKLCIPSDAEKSWTTLKESINLYYELFPEAIPDRLDKMWLSLAKDVYRTLLKHNPAILAVVTKVATPQAAAGHDQFKIDWHCLRSEIKSLQVYFWNNKDGFNRKFLQPILEKTGMKITNAPFRIMTHFNSVMGDKEYRLPSTTPQSVFAYYTQHYKQVSSSGFPADISETSFVTVEDFKMFTKYLLLPNNSCHEFPSSPFGYPLLLTADNKLRVFIADEKILFSKYLELFPKSQSKFLHSHLLDIEYSPEYFLGCLPNDIVPGQNVVHEVVQHELPAKLKASRVIDSEQYISHETLANLWKCFMDDLVFRFHVKTVIKDFALILTTENELYSTSSQVLPVYSPDTDDENQTVYQVLKQIKVPFVLKEVVNAPANVLCSPTLSDPTAILKNLYRFNACVDLASILKKEQVEILIRYIKSCNLGLPDSCTHVKSLPLFETIDDSFTPIGNKVACVWPLHMCKAGYKKWVAFHNVVFLKRDAAWEMLRASEVLHIESICQEDIYTRYIFPHFACMNEKERYAHLKHIRDHLYHNNAYYKRSVSDRTILTTTLARAISFIDALTRLACLGEDGSTLKPLSRFCSPDVQIFQVFSAHFNVLPRIFTNDSKEKPRWMKFFEGIGLRVSLTQSEYLQFCNDTAKGCVEDIPKSSAVLVQYLFDEQAEKDKWHHNALFLSQVSQIAYVCTEQLPKYAWIAPIVCPSNKVQQAGRTVYMTQFCTAILSSQSHLIWTIKPVVAVTSFYPSLISGLRITKEPSVQDVLQNIATVSKKGKFTDFRLFDNYPQTLKQPPKGANLMEVMLEVFEFLKRIQQSMSATEKNFLSELPCIPVYSTVSKTPEWQLVLVKPKFVLTCDIGSKFHPFLHQLPDTLLPVVPLLRAVGVKNSVDIHHMQILLQKVYECSEEQDLDINTEKCVVRAIKMLDKLLKEIKESTTVLKNSDLVSALSPLYLLSSEKKLVLSTSLVHDDVSEYQLSSAHVSLDDTGLSKLDLRACEFHSVSHFCNSLPESVRPKLLTQICLETISKDCQEVEHSDTALSLERTLKMPIIPKAILAIVKHVTKDEKLCTDLKQVLLVFLPRIKIVSVKNLKVVFNMNDTGAEICSARKDFFFHYEQQGKPVLYLDSKLKDLMRDLAINEIALQLMREIRKLNPTISYSTQEDISKTLKLLLKAETDDDVKTVLGHKRITLDTNSDELEMEDLDFELGKEIPECWHHRLDHDINNVFHPLEYVGYEEEEGKVICAQILYPMLPEGAADFESIPRLDMKFKIRIVKGDDTGVTAGVLDLYKFLRGLKHEPEPAEGDDVSTALVPFEGESEATKVRNQIKREDLKAIKTELCKELQEIWKLPDDQKKKAIKRLYLKWHPDKNPDNPDLAEEVFKFLQTQIEHLEAGQPLDDPEGEPTPAPHSSRWRGDFYQWAYTAQQQANYQRSEYRSRRRGRRPRGSRGQSSGSGGGESYGDFFSLLTDSNHKRNL